MLSRSFLTSLTLTARALQPVATAAIVIGVGVYAWRTYLRLQAERQWAAEWDAYQRTQR